MDTFFRTRRRATALTALTALSALALGAAGAGPTAAWGVDSDPDGGRTVERFDEDALTQVVKVSARTPKERTAVSALGLDVTEAGDRSGVEVVLHGARDAKVLRDAGYTWDVVVKDLEALRARNARKDRQYAARVRTSPLPSGQDHYRTLADYNRELRQLAATYPHRVSLIRLENKSRQGRTVHGIEVTRHVRRTDDGKPVFLMMGAHHAREWPSSEHTLEFAYDLLENDRFDRRATQIVKRGRTIFVPVVNVDGFDISRSAAPLGDFSTVDYEMKRKNCDTSLFTPERYLGGTCADNPAGRLRGTDLNRNYPGFWGGPGASSSWSSDTYRGDGPGSEPEVDSVRTLISERQVTGLITNHTYSTLVLRPPSLASTGLAPDEDKYQALGAMMTDANNYTNWASYQLYDTSGSVEDWSYWNTGGFGFTFEIGDQGFHPTYKDAVVAEYLGLPPAAGARQGGNREAYYRFARANLDQRYHATITGKAPANRELSLYKQFTSLTSPIVVGNDPRVTTDPLGYTDVLTSSYASTGGGFSWAVNPSTRPAVAGRGGREPQAPAQPSIALTNPAGIPAERESEQAQFEIVGLPEYDNGTASVSVGWPGESGDEAVDWDVSILNADGEVVSQAASLANPEVAVLIDPVPGVYTVVVGNYAGGSAQTDWSGEVTFAQPTPPVMTGVKEAWMLSCTKRNGDVLATQDVVVDRGESIDVGNACRQAKP